MNFLRSSLVGGMCLPLAATDPGIPRGDESANLLFGQNLPKTAWK